MTDDRHRLPGVPIEVDSTDRWVAGKDEAELLSDLKVYLARLRDDPRSIVDRLRVAAIQLRLGRTQEALIHYEGVLRGYVAEGQIMNAIALCQRILHLFPQLPRIQRIMAALYARAPRGSTGAPAAVTPILNREDTNSFVVADPAADLVEEEVEEDVIVDRVFPEVRPVRLDKLGRDLLTSNEDLRPTIPIPIQTGGQGLLEVSTEQETIARNQQETLIVEDDPLLLTQAKERGQDLPPPLPADSEEVVLLTRPKQKK